MIKTEYSIPFYAKVALISIGLFAFVYTLYIGQLIIIPIVFSIILSILLNPLVNYFNRFRIPKLISITFVVMLAIALGMIFLYIISTQLSMFSETYPQLKEKFNLLSTDVVRWVSKNFNIRVSKINTWKLETQNEAISNFATGERLTEIGQVIMIGTLIPVYVFMLLYYKPLLLEFIYKLFRIEHHTTVVSVLVNTKKIVQTYLVGLFFEMIIVAVLNSVGLLLLGIEYAIILGIIGAVLNIIPYLGGIVATALPMLIAFITKDSLVDSMLVFFLYMFIQFIDNNYIVPKIVASRVQINSLISVVAVLIGGAIWGIPGMFLSIPLTAILKAVFDHIEPLKPWGFLLGNIVPTTSKFSFIRIKKAVRL